MKTCTITVELFVSGTSMLLKRWENVDIMKTSHTRGYATRIFNKWLADFDATYGLQEKVIRVEWNCRYDDDSYSFRGKLAGTKGRKVTQSGIFDQ